MEIDELATLIAIAPPPFVFVHDAVCLRDTISALECALALEENATAHVRRATVNGISCFTPRLLYDHAINSLADWSVEWNEGWKQKQAEEGFQEEVRFAIVIEHAERLRSNMPDLLVPLTRLAELTRLDLTVVFVSQVRWEDMKPSLGASPDPYFLDMPPPKKDRMALWMSLSYLQLYNDFVSILCDVCYPFTHDPREIQYIAAARWPGFVQPVLDEHNQRIDREDEDVEEDDEHEVLRPPSADTRLKLSRLFKPTLTNALEELYPRITNATVWANLNSSPPDPDYISLSRPSTDPQATGLSTLPRMSKFIIIAAFLASTNPAKSDVRMFGRGLDEKKRRKRRASTMTKAGNGPAKVPQRLLGPTPFPFDRLMAILGSLLEENDVDGEGSRAPADDVFHTPGEHTDMEITRVGVYTSVVELASMWLLHRTSPSDRLEGPPMYKCGISYEDTLGLAKELDVPLNDLLWDPA
ncbi:origin recognition complex subunit 5 C-terminus-domain-containing protein [Amanita rubescens]|nr:origin recognition complex subunit 5 C-terminus-domain-containing protein [Amanita rubescens]